MRCHHTCGSFWLFRSLQAFLSVHAVLMPSMNGLRVRDIRTPLSSAAPLKPAC